jgi:hypothetical protein
MQVNMKGSEANLAFPTMLNEAFDTFSHTIEQSDTAPTQSQYTVFRMLSTKLNEQLKIWEQIRTVDLPAINNLVRESNVPILTTINADSVGTPRTLEGWEALTLEGIGRAKHIFERHRGKMCQPDEVRTEQGMRGSQSLL